MKLRSPCCNAKTTEGKHGRRRCPKCGGQFDADEIASGRVEGGDYDDRDPSARLMMEESGGPTGRIRHKRELRGGL